MDLLFKIWVVVLAFVVTGLVVFALLGVLMGLLIRLLSEGRK